jgi:hypothetical protein
MNDGQKRRRDQRQSSPKPMQLTERDRLIIEAVHHYRVLRQDQIQMLFFGGKSATQRTLAHLYDHGFLERKFLPVLYGRSPTLYVLDRRGAELLRAERGYDHLQWYSSSKDLKTDFLEHTLAINDFRIAVTLGCHLQGHQLVRWLGESELKTQYDRVNIPTEKGKHQSVSLIPDSYFQLATTQGHAHFFVEVDRGTETLARFETKVRAYVAYYKSGGYERRYHTQSLRILTLVQGERRLRNLLSMTEQVTNEVGGQRRFCFALASTLNVQTVLGTKLWFMPNEALPHALIDPPK